jgi:hypothetical protein
MITMGLQGDTIVKLYTLFVRTRENGEQYVAGVNRGNTVKLTNDVTRALPFNEAREAYDFARDKPALQDFRAGARAWAGAMRKPQKAEE